MPDGKALQAGTSHEFGQNFSKAYDIKFTDVDEQVKYAYTTSWGVSWRVLGGLIMAHGDDHGLVLPPAVAPYHAVIVPIVKKGDESVMPAARGLEAELRSVARVKLDDRLEQSAAWKFNEWEMRGVPLRIEIGPRDVAAQSVTVARRDTLEKSTIPTASLARALPGLLEQIRASLYARARKYQDDHTVEVTERGAFVEALKRQDGFVLAAWCEQPECEADIKAETSAVTRVIAGEAAPGERCAYCGVPAKVKAYFARSY
jgi:prolyl-tRNA synthetase